MIFGCVYIWLNGQYFGANGLDARYRRSLWNRKIRHWYCWCGYFQARSDYEGEETLPMFRMCSDASLYLVIDSGRVLLGYCRVDRW
jgi:hypothetical protein